MSAHALTPGVPRLFRTYETTINEEYDIAIWQAARATTTSPLLFDPVRIGPRGREEPFVDGSLGCNNPLDILLEEAFRVFPDRHVTCVVSVGAGQLRPTSSLSRDIVDMLANIASDCEETANEADLLFANTPGVYFRFNVAQGLESVEDSEEQNQAAAVKASTDSYISADEVCRRMANAVGTISSRSPGNISTRQLRMSTTNFSGCVFGLERKS